MMTWFSRAPPPLLPDPPPPTCAFCVEADKVLTRNHRGVAVLLLVAVLVGTEAFHEAQVALSQKLAARWRVRGRGGSEERSDQTFDSSTPPLPRGTRDIGKWPCARAISVAASLSRR